MSIFTNKKAQLSVTGATDKLLTITIFGFVAAAIVPIVLISFTQLSTSGIVLGTLFATVLPILLAVFLFRSLMGATRGR